VLNQIYGDIRKAQADLKNAKKIREEMLQGYDSESDMKRYNYPLWENNFGPNAPDYDVTQAEKQLKAAERKLKQQMKDELYDYTPSSEANWDKDWEAEWRKKSEKNWENKWKNK